MAKKKKIKEEKKIGINHISIFLLVCGLFFVVSFLFVIAIGSTSSKINKDNFIFNKFNVLNKVESKEILMEPLSLFAKESFKNNITLKEVIVPINKSNNISNNNVSNIQNKSLKIVTSYKINDEKEVLMNGLKWD